MLSVLVAVVMVMSAAVAFAQEGVQVDVVHLKNGSIVRCTLGEYVACKTMKIKTTDVSLFVYSADEVDRVEREFGEQKSKSKAAESKGQTSEAHATSVSSRKKRLNVFLGVSV